VVYLYAQDAKQAWQVFQDCLEVANFVSCEEAFAADALFLAYKSGSADAVRKVVSDKYAFKNLDNQVARLAAKLPQGARCHVLPHVCLQSSASEVPAESSARPPLPDPVPACICLWTAATASCCGRSAKPGSMCF
jgi:hypothetical protein